MNVCKITSIVPKIWTRELKNNYILPMKKWKYLSILSHILLNIHYDCIPCQVSMYKSTPSDMAAVSYMWLLKFKLKLNAIINPVFHSHRPHSVAQESHVASGYCTTQNKCRVFPSLWQVLLDGAVIDHGKINSMNHGRTITWTFTNVLH